MEFYPLVFAVKDDGTLEVWQDLLIEDDTIMGVSTMTRQQVMDRLARDKGTPLEALWRAALRLFELEQTIHDATY